MSLCSGPLWVLILQLPGPFSWQSPNGHGLTRLLLSNPLQLEGGGIAVAGIESICIALKTYSAGSKRLQNPDEPPLVTLFATP